MLYILRLICFIPCYNSNNLQYTGNSFLHKFINLRGSHCNSGCGMLSDKSSRNLFVTSALSHAIYRVNLESSDITALSILGQSLGSPGSMAGLCLSTIFICDGRTVLRLIQNSTQSSIYISRVIAGSSTLRENDSDQSCS